ncbi:hypothetical protein [Deinococcus radiophilus]
MAGIAALGLLLIFSVVAFVTGHGALGAALLALTLLVVLVIGYLGLQTAQRGVRQGRRRAAEVREDLNLDRASLEQRGAERDLIRLLNRHESRLPATSRPQLRATVSAMHAAMQATRGELGREAYEVRQAAQEDLPRLLELAGPEQQADLAEALGLIERRMGQIADEQRQRQRRDYDTQREYLRGKYAPGEALSDHD